MAQVWECDIGHAEQSILLSLADHAHDDGTKVFPSLRRTAWKTAYSVRQVRRILRSLEGIGALEIVHTGGGVFSTEYRINLRKLPKKAAMTTTPVKMSGVPVPPDKTGTEIDRKCPDPPDIAMSSQSSSNHPINHPTQSAVKTASKNGREEFWKKRGRKSEPQPVSEVLQNLRSKT